VFNFGGCELGLADWSVTTRDVDPDAPLSQWTRSRSPISFFGVSTVKQLLLEVVHDDVAYVSDRSLRELLKRLSKILRRVELHEIRDIILDSGMDDREIRALMSAMEREIETLPAYYLRKIEKGSLVANFAIGAAAVAALAGTIFKDLVTDVIKQSKFYKKLIEYVSGERSEKFARNLKRELEENRAIITLT
jgi:predicted butyrate kinase (DUF1464 family)